jgi:hypothetical protein
LALLAPLRPWSLCISRSRLYLARNIWTF